MLRKSPPGDQVFVQAADSARQLPHSQDGKAAVIMFLCLRQHLSVPVEPVTGFQTRGSDCFLRPSPRMSLERGLRA